MNLSTATRASKAGPELEKVRVWWEPTDNKNRDGYAGAYWPAKVLQKIKNKLLVQYDNGDKEEVHVEHVSELDSLPFDFGEEEDDLEPTEFCEVFNGSKTDPCAWFGRVTKKTKTGTYIVDYPFHDSKSERIEGRMIRRARVMEDGEWRLVKPGQEWEDGEVTSPMELELIHEDDLCDHLDQKSDGGAASAKRVRTPEEEDSPEEDILEDEEQRPKKRGRPRKTQVGGPLKSRDAPAGPSEAQAEKAPKPRVRERKSGEAEEKVDAGPASSVTPVGMVGLYMTVEVRGPRGGICLVPTKNNLPITGAVQVYLPLGALTKQAAALDKPMRADSAATPLTQPAMTPLEVLVAATATAAGVLVPVPAASQRGRRVTPTPAAAAEMVVDLSQPAPAAKESSQQKADKDTSQRTERDSSHKADKPKDVKAERSKEDRKHKSSNLKRPKTAWNVFVERNRRSVIEANPGKENGEVNQMLGIKWRDASEEEKAACEAEVERDKARYTAAIIDLQSQKAKADLEITKKGDVELAMSNAPIAARSAQQLYSIEFLKALHGAPGGAGTVTGPAALAAATVAWNTADGVVKTRYLEKEAADKTRFEREHKAWLEQQEDIDDVLNKGVDMKKMKRRLHDLGFLHEAYVMFADVWRKDSARVNDAIRAYKMHVFNRPRPNWHDLLVTLFGMEKVQNMKKKDKESKVAEASEAVGTDKT